MIRSSIRVKLWVGAVFSAALLLGLAGMNVFTLKRNAEMLEDIHARHVLPVSYLEHMTAELKDARYHSAMVLLDKYATLGALNKLVDTRVAIPRYWQAYMAMYRSVKAPSEDKARLVAEIDAQMPFLADFLDRLGQAYRVEDRDILAAKLEDDWVTVQIRIIGPLQQLLPVQRDHSRLVYEQARQTQHRIAQLSLTLSATGLIFFATFAYWLLGYINRNLTRVNATLRRVAEGDLSAKAVAENPGDELGMMVDSLNRTLATLREDRREIAELLNRNELLLNAAGEGIYGTDPDGRITFANPACARLTGHAIEELLGRASHELLHHHHPDGRPYPRQECPLYRTISEGEAVFSAEEVFWRKDGTPLPVLYSSTPLLEGKEVKGAVVMFTDIASRKEAEDALRRNYEELRALHAELAAAQGQLLQSEKLASIGQLAAGVAHEINNPMGFVSSNLGTLEGYLQGMFKLLDAADTACEALPDGPRAGVRRLMEEMDLPFIREDAADLIRESKQGIARVRKIVQDLLDFTASGSDEDWTFVEPERSLDNTVALLARELGERIELRREYGGVRPIRAIPAQLGQVWLNLLLNAIQAIDGPGRITLRTGRDGETAWVEIADTGRGIPDHLVGQIFDPFFTTKEVGKGTGLGLSMCHSIVRRHGGRCDVTSEPGKGSVFRVTLPIHGVPAGPVVASSGAVEDNLPSSQPPADS